MSQSELPIGVGNTALAAAWVRAGESRRPDRLFDAPYAEAFAARPGRVPPPAGRRPRRTGRSGGGVG